jgi:hypothetical protein
LHDANALTVQGLLLVSLAGCAAGDGTTVVGYGFVELDANPENRIVGLQTTLVVPAEPPGAGTLFLWPGLQPQTGGAGYDPIGNGVLQPVLAWGTSCAPGTEPAMYATWWISGQYYDDEGTDPAHAGCYGGAIMSAPVAEPLRIRMTLSGTLWQQTVVGPAGTVGFDEDLMGQAQNRALFVIEGYSAAPVSDVIFTDTTITFASPDAGDCAVARRGQNDFVSTPVPSTDGTSCFIERIVLRARGLPATE